MRTDDEDNNQTKRSRRASVTALPSVTNDQPPGFPGSRRFNNLIDVLVCCAIGAVTWRLSWAEHVESFKLLSLAGLCLNFASVMLLSYLILVNQKWKQLIANVLTESAERLCGYTPMTIMAVGLIAGFADAPSGFELAKFGLSTMWILLFPMLFINLIPLFTKYRLFEDPKSKIIFFGSFLLIAGILMQIFAAYQDLMSAMGR